MSRENYGNGAFVILDYEIQRSLESYFSWYYGGGGLLGFTTNDTGTTKLQLGINSTIGLEYTFDNSYPTAAMPLSDQKAIFITTRNPVEALLGDSNQDGEVNVIDVVIIVNHILVLELLSSMGSFMSDMDGDGNITILDVIQVIQVILES